MKKFWNHWLVYSSVFLTATTSAFAQTDNFLDGVARGQLSGDMSSYSAGAAAVEAGPRNYRVSGTVGLRMNPRNRIKITGEWLWQDIDYGGFFTDTTREWVQQPAVGLGYQLALNNRFINYFDLGGYYSHAPSKTLINVDFLDVPSGNIFTEMRRIAGSTAGGANAGVHFHPWCGAEGSLALNWDDVVYDNQNTDRVTAKGFGGTVALTQDLQAFGQDFEMGLSAAIRRPFDFYRAELNWVNPLPGSQLLIGIFGDYNRGKDELPNTGLVGLNLSFAVDAPVSRTKTGKGINPDSLLAWVNQPAVYMPQVLAISDEAINQCTVGAGPGFRGQIADVKLSDLPLDLSHRFTGNGPFTFTLTKSSGNAQIDASGKVTATVPSTNVVVTASGPCGGPASTNSFNITAS